jgi:hypothetical protein
LVCSSKSLVTTIRAMVLISMGVSCCCVQDGINQFIQPQIVSALPDQLMDRDCFLRRSNQFKLAAGPKVNPLPRGELDKTWQAVARWMSFTSEAVYVPSLTLLLSLVDLCRDGASGSGLTLQPPFGDSIPPWPRICRFMMYP